MASLLLHAALLSLRFVNPDQSALATVNRGLEVILMNTADQRVPLQAEALAQVNLDGGGNAESGRATSPLPDRGRTADGSLLDMQRQRVAELEQQQARLFAQFSANKSERLMPRPQSANTTDIMAANDNDATEALLARREAEISRDISDYNQRPVKTQLTPRTRKVAYAMYYTALQQRIEQTGTRHFPERDGKKLYGVISRFFRMDPFMKKRVGRASSVVPAARHSIRPLWPLFVVPRRLDNFLSSCVGMAGRMCGKSSRVFISPAIRPWSRVPPELYLDPRIRT